MRRAFRSALLAAALIVAATIPAYADTPTQTDQEFSISVPAVLAPGGSGDVTLSGTWEKSKTYTLTTDSSVELTCDIDGDTQTLSISFPGITLQGGDDAVSATEQVRVGDITDAIFGTWTGVFEYHIESATCTHTGETVTQNAKEATCTEEGYTGDVYCVDCGALLTEGNIVEKTTHDLDDTYACTICSEAFTPFAVNASNRAAIGYTGEENEVLVIPAYFTGDGENGTTEGTQYIVTEIEGWAFMSCESLASVVFPDTVTIIGNYVFGGCTALSSITIPESVVSIGDGVFYACTSLTQFIVAEDNLQYIAVDNALFTKDMQLLVSYALGSPDTSYSIPNSVTKICNHAFFCAYNLLDIDLGDSLVTIEKVAFGDCNFENIELPDTVTTIESHAFQNNPFTTIDIPSSVTFISKTAFYDCKNLTAINIHNVKGSIMSENGAAYGLDSSIYNWLGEEDPTASTTLTAEEPVPDETPIPDDEQPTDGVYGIENDTTLQTNGAVNPDDENSAPDANIPPEDENAGENNDVNTPNELTDDIDENIEQGEAPEENGDSDSDIDEDKRAEDEGSGPGDDAPDIDDIIPNDANTDSDFVPNDANSDDVNSNADTIEDGVTKGDEVRSGDDESDAVGNIDADNGDAVGNGEAAESNNDADGDSTIGADDTTGAEGAAETGSAVEVDEVNANVASVNTNQNLEDSMRKAVA